MSGSVLLLRTLSHHPSRSKQSMVTPSRLSTMASSLAICSSRAATASSGSSFWKLISPDCV